MDRKTRPGVRASGGRPPKRGRRRWALLPVLLVSVAFVLFGFRELWPGEGVFGIAWTVCAGVVTLWLAVQMLRREVTPRRLWSEDEEVEIGYEGDAVVVTERPAPPEEPEEDLEEPDIDAIDDEFGREAWRRARAKADAEARADAEERLKHLEALRDLRSIDEAEYVRRRREIEQEL